jgi:hypothetical protein
MINNELLKYLTLNLIRHYLAQIYSIENDDLRLPELLGTILLKIALLKAQVDR